MVTWCKVATPSPSEWINLLFPNKILILGHAFGAVPSFSTHLHNTVIGHWSIVGEEFWKCAQTIGSEARMPEPLQLCGQPQLQLSVSRGHQPPKIFTTLPEDVELLANFSTNVSQLSMLDTMIILDASEFLKRLHSWVHKNYGWSDTTQGVTSVPMMSNLFKDI